MSVSIRPCPSIAVVLLSVILFLFLPIPAQTAEPPAAPAAAPLTAEGAQHLARAIRAIAAGVAADYAWPQELQKPLEFPLIVTLYSTSSPIQRISTETSFPAAASDIASQFRAFIKTANIAEALDRARMEIVIPVRMGQPFRRDRALALNNLEPGLTGLVCNLGDRKVTFTPLTLFAHAQGYDALNSAFTAQESVEAPRRIDAQPFRAVEYVESVPMGEMLSLYRGNVLQPQPSPTQMVESLATGGIWLVNAQQEDGRFLSAYLPTLDRSLQEYDLGDHLRAAIALVMLNQLFQKEQFSQAFTKALDYAMGAERLKRDDGTGLIYLPLPSDDVSGSALLLTALSIKALQSEKPAATGAMRQLGEYLCAMIAPNGRLYAGLKNAKENKPPFIVRGGIYADALIALTMLQRIAPSDRASEAAGRLADVLVAEPADIQIRADNRTLGRVTEAMAEYYRLSRQEKYADKALQFCAQLQRSQVKVDSAEFPDYIGGFADKNAPPYTFNSASAACGLAAAYEAALLSHRPRSQFYAPLRAAAGFLMNMQYRQDNSFYLPRPEMARGAFRRAPTDLNLYCGAIAEAIRALLNATTVTVELAPPE